MGSTNFGRDYGTPPTVNGAPVSTSNPEPVTGTVTANQGAAGATPWGVVSSGALTDRSGVITTGGTAQNVMAANSSRKYVRLKNPDTATEDLYYSFTGTASASSDVLHAGDEARSGFFTPTHALSVFAATTGHVFVAEEA